MTSRLSKFVLPGLLLAVILIAVLLFTRPDFHAEIGASSSQKVADFKNGSATKNKEGPAVNKPTPSQKQRSEQAAKSIRENRNVQKPVVKLTESEQRISDRLWQEFYNIEKTNAKIVSDITTGTEQRVVLWIHNPTKEQIENCHAIASQLRTESLTATADEQGKLKKLIEKLLNEGLSCPATYRIVFLVRNEENGQSSLIERWTNKDDAFDYSGKSFKIPASEKVRMEPYFQDKDSWGAKRFGHLFGLESAPPKRRSL